MALLKEVNTADVATATFPRGGNRPFAGFATERPRAKVWANIGYMKGDRFVNLPLGSPVDTMEPAPVRGQNEDWVTQQSDRNEFLATLQAIGNEMEPGEERELFNIVVRLRRVNDELEIKEPEGKLSQADLINLFTAAPKKPTAPKKPKLAQE
jgi:hypothetical protein